MARDKLFAEAIIRKEEERNQWGEIEKHVVFYPQEEDTTTEAWNVREATKEMKVMDIDLVAHRKRKTFNREVMMRLIRRYI